MPNAGLREYREDYNISDRVEQNPGAALEVFQTIDAALNVVLPGREGYHQRYADIGEVGLATVVARERAIPGLYNPLDPATPEDLSFIAHNRNSHPEAWKPIETDETVLGGPIPEWLPGRFAAFALGKVHVLSNSSGVWESFSHSVDNSKQKPGEFANAGGRRFPGSFLAVSGLWEIHDHVVGVAFYDQVDKATSTDSKPATADNLAGDLEAVLDEIKRLHEGTKAEELTREQVAALLRRADGYAAQRLRKLKRTDRA